jgi:hypothetical protein
MNYKINLLPYNYVVKEFDAPGKPEKEIIKKCDVRDMIVKVILNPRLAHKGFRFFTVAKTARKIQLCKEDSILLNSTEYTIIKECFDNMQGFGPNDVDLVNRVYESEEVK